MNRKQGLAVATAALFLSLTARAEEGATTKDSAEAKIECHGVNACKGQGECGGKGHACGGKNACKGKGWVSMTKADCDQAKAKLKKDKKNM